jgi:hypothetical protein
VVPPRSVLRRAHVVKAAVISVVRARRVAYLGAGKVEAADQILPKGQ